MKVVEWACAERARLMVYPVMSQSDPIVFAAKAARMAETELFAELQQVGEESGKNAWRQAVEDELLVRRLMPHPPGVRD